MRFLACAVFMACISGLARCAPQDDATNHQYAQAGDPPARSVPTHVLTRDQAGSRTQAEQGDFIEVRLQQLDAGIWQLLRQTGDGRLKALGQAAFAGGDARATQMFRFRAERIGSVELAFVLQAAPNAPRPATVVAFDITIK